MNGSGMHALATPITSSKTPRRARRRRAADPDLMSATEVAALLGLSKTNVYDGAHRGDIPHRKVGARLLFSRRAVLAWIHHGQVEEGGRQPQDDPVPSCSCRRASQKEGQ